MEILSETQAGSAVSPLQCLPRPLLYIVVSIVLLVPCFWQSRIQAGDLSSHIYNTWLARQIERGEAPGLEIVPQATNVLFDLMLARLYGPLGPSLTQRVAVSVAVLNFFWGAFYFISVVSRKRPWFLMPFLAMLAYGWVFHTGLFNFYLALGLCWWALAFLWKGGRRVLLAVPLLALAFVAHGLPVAWAAAMGIYVWLSRRLTAARGLVLGGVAFVAIVGQHFFLMRHYSSTWSLWQTLRMTGLDQVVVFGPGFLLVVAALLAVAGYLMLRLTKTTGLRNFLLSLPVQLAILDALGIALVPSKIELPYFNHALVYIAERMSLTVAILTCASFASVRAGWFERAGLAAITIAYFGMLYVKTAELNRLEDQVQALVRGLPPMQRVISPLLDPNSRTPWLTHLVDRACIGICYSYGNYEPSTAQFRVRARARNLIVVNDYDDTFAMQTGAYRPRDDDPSLYQIADCGRRLCLTLLNEGKR